MIIRCFKIYLYIYTSLFFYVYIHIRIFIISLLLRIYTLTHLLYIYIQLFLTFDLKITQFKIKIMSQQDSLKQSKITIDSDEKLVAYNNFHDYARKLTEESIKINALAKQVNFNLCCIVRRMKIFTHSIMSKKCLNNFL
jgi:hypothetical protein